MPKRFIKDSITTSETLAGISAYAERHFYRLLVQADDFGRFDARPQVIRSRGYSVMLGQVTGIKSEQWTLELAAAGLITLYESDGKRYGYFPTWRKHQTPRARESKHPEPPSCEQVVSNGNHLRADEIKSAQMNADVLVSESVSVSGSVSVSDIRPSDDTEASSGESPETQRPSPEPKTLEDWRQVLAEEVEKPAGRNPVGVLARAHCHFHGLDPPAKDMTQLCGRVGKLVTITKTWMPVTGDYQAVLEALYKASAEAAGDPLDWVQASMLARSNRQNGRADPARFSDSDLYEQEYQRLEERKARNAESG